ncbi:alpha-amylase family glycosyl hydrolase [Balneolales bacterium ANBcel1]|nr:alpha-amylase family glycosyl hydrolase [Balneolales bacterium ANBcel1]
MKKKNLGASPVKGGYRFRVWAPHADEVFIVGTFNDWDKTSHPMKPEGDGVWSLTIRGAKAGDEYRYRIIHGKEDAGEADENGGESRSHKKGRPGKQGDGSKSDPGNGTDKHGKELLRIDPYARRVTNSVGNTIIKYPHCKKRIDFRLPPLNEWIIYELHIGTFGKMDGHDGPGTLDVAIDRLSYLKELGVNVIEIMPLAEFAGGYSWGYNPAHIFAVESDYGTPRSFREFVNKAHRLGMAVILDVVYNHFGPSDLDLWQFDGWHENNMGGIYFYNDDRANTPWGDTRPDYGRQEVRNYIRDNALMWFEEYDIDGLRWDMTAFIRNVYGRNNDPHNDLPDGWSLMQWVNEEIRRVKPEAITIAEDLQGNPYLTKKTDDFGAGFDSQWAAPFVHAVRDALIVADDADRDMEAVRDAVLHRYYLNAFERVIYTESHDEVANGKARVPEEIDPGSASSWEAKKRSTLGATIMFTSPGIPMMFQGQEFLEDDWFHDQDPIDWTKKETYAGILQLYRNLIGLRLNKTGKAKGLTGQEVNVFHVNNADKLIAYHRWDSGGAGDSVVVVANFSRNKHERYNIGFPHVGEWIVRFNSDSRFYDSGYRDFGSDRVQAEGKSRDGLPAQAELSIAPYSALILTLG